MNVLHRRRPILTIVAAVALAGATGCSSDKNPSTADADTAPDAATVAETMLRTGGDSAVIVLTDEQVSAALASAPSPASIESFEFVGSGAIPTEFTVRVKIVASSEGAYEFEVVDAATDRPLAVADLAVSADGVQLAQHDTNGQIRIDEAEVSPAYFGAFVEVGGLDVGSARQLSARVRLVANPGVERPWEDVLGCTDGVTTFQWRHPDDDIIEIGTCPSPFAWTSTEPKVPLLAPTPEQVASAAGFTGTASLEQHLARLFAAVGGDNGPYDPLHLKIEINMLIEMAPGFNRSVPLELLGPMAAPDWDPAVVAASVEQAIEYTAQNPTALEFNIQVISTDPKATVLAVNGVQLPLTAASAD